MTSQLLIVVEETGVHGKNLCFLEVTGNLLTCLRSDLNPVNSEGHRAVSFLNSTVVFFPLS